MRRFVRQWNTGISSNPCLCGEYSETCAALGQVPKQWWSVPLACLLAVINAEFRYIAFMKRGLRVSYLFPFLYFILRYYQKRRMAR
jgi:hypothetical protein